VILGPLTYSDIQSAVEAGVLVVFAAGTCDGEPTLAWMATVLQQRSAEIAHSKHAKVRAAQAIGAIAELRRHAAPHGFTPA
jgi:hypothetical protein